MKSENYMGHHSVAVKENTMPMETVPDADMISLETIVHVLVNKGICTREELLAFEESFQRKTQGSQQNNYVNIQNTHDRGRFSGLKRSMSRHRWSRRLGTLLFGWKWKKVKKK